MQDAVWAKVSRGRVWGGLMQAELQRQGEGAYQGKRMQDAGRAEASEAGRAVASGGVNSNGRAQSYLPEWILCRLP